MKPAKETVFQDIQVTYQERLRKIMCLPELNPESKFQVSQNYLNFHCLGYGGYVPGVKSENVFGQTYGKTSYASAAGNFHRGIDEPANIKYQSMFK